MLADILKTLHDTEDQAEQILAQANLQVREIEKQTYQRLTKIENNTNAEIAEAVSQLPQPQPIPAPTVELKVPQAKMDHAVTEILQAVYGA